MTSAKTTTLMPPLGVPPVFQEPPRSLEQRIETLAGYQTRWSGSRFQESCANVLWLLAAEAVSAEEAASAWNGDDADKQLSDLVAEGTRRLHAQIGQGAGVKDYEARFVMGLSQGCLEVQQALQGYLLHVPLLDGAPWDGSTTSHRLTCQLVFALTRFAAACVEAEWHEQHYIGEACRDWFRTSAPDGESLDREINRIYNDPEACDDFEAAPPLFLNTDPHELLADHQVMERILTVCRAERLEDAPTESWQEAVAPECSFPTPELHAWAQAAAELLDGFAAAPKTDLSAIEGESELPLDMGCIVARGRKVCVALPCSEWDDQASAGELPGMRFSAPDSPETAASLRRYLRQMVLANAQLAAIEQLLNGDEDDRDHGGK